MKCEEFVDDLEYETDHVTVGLFIPKSSVNVKSKLLSTIKLQGVEENFRFTEA